MFWAVVCSCILLGVSSASEPDTFEYLVNLFNGLFIDSALSFKYNFGSGVPLLQGKAKVTLHPPLKLLPSSNVSYPNSHKQLCSLNLQTLGNINVFYADGSKKELVLRECRIELDVIYNTMLAHTVVPSRLWLSNCSSVEFCDGEEPEVSDQVLPMLSQAMFNIAVKHFSRSYGGEKDIKSDVSINFKILKEMFPLLILWKGKLIESHFGDNSC